MKNKKTIILILTLSIAVAIIGNQHVNLLKELADINNCTTIVVDKKEQPKPSMEETVMEMITEAGLNQYEAWFIINCESGWNQWAYNFNTNKTSDLGLWQINSIHQDTISVEDRFDPIKATEWAINKRLNDGHWNAWVCGKKL